MIIRYSKNVLEQVAGITWNNRNGILAYTLISLFAVGLHRSNQLYGTWMPVIPAFPVTILGGALAIFLGFRNNSAYDRWWEARKIWGAIVNDSRTWASYVLSFGSTHHSGGTNSEAELKAWQKQLVYRHIAWLYSLIAHLRTFEREPFLKKYLADAEIREIEQNTNTCTHLLHHQNLLLKHGHESKFIEDFRHMELAGVVKDFFTHQGMLERIKRTVFPYYYNYFTRFFLWIFIILLPLTLIQEMGYGTIPMTVVISFIFFILEKSGSITEDPFENRAADIPMLTITRNIEIDLLEMLGETDIPEPEPLNVGKFHVVFSK